jgi:hypothetical protein
VVTAALVPGLGTFREATDLVQEAAGKLPEAWQRLTEALHELLQRARRLPASGGVWAAVAERYAGDIGEAIAAADALMARIGPVVGAAVEVLTSIAARAVGVLTLFDSAIAVGGAAEHLAGLSAEMGGRGDLESWRGTARDAYDQRVREQVAAADAAAAEVAAAARWLAAIGAANTAYVTNVGHLAADLVSRFAGAAVEAGAAAPGDVPRLVATLERLESTLESAGRRATGWARDLQDHFAATLARADVPTFGAWPAASSMA